MASTHEDRNQFIALTRGASRQLLDMKEQLDGLKTDWDGGMSTYLIDASGNDPDNPNYEGHDFTPNAEGLMKADITAAFNTFGNILSAFTSGDITNLVNVKKVS